jgi:hypothetical protein
MVTRRTVAMPGCSPGAERSEDSLSMRERTPVPSLISSRVPVPFVSG